MSEVPSNNVLAKWSWVYGYAHLEMQPQEICQQ